MLARITEKEAVAMRKAVRLFHQYDSNPTAGTEKDKRYLTMRKFAREMDLGPKTVVSRCYYEIVKQFVECLYNPLDKGAHGKHTEGNEHVDLNGNSWIYYREFFAHGHGETDIKKSKLNSIPHELKTGTGDFLVTDRFTTVEEIANEYLHKETYIRWTIDGVNKSHSKRAGEPVQFDIFCTWAQLFAYLSTYKGGIETFIKVTPKVGTDKVVFAFQEVLTSNSKIALLEGCEYNRLRK